MRTRSTSGRPSSRRACSATCPTGRTARTSTGPAPCDTPPPHRGRTHQMAIPRWGADYPDPDNLATALADFDARVLAYRNQWDHPIKRTAQQAVQELDRAKRDAMYRQIQKVVLDEGPYVIIGYPLRLLALR